MDLQTLSGKAVSSENARPANNFRPYSHQTAALSCGQSDTAGGLDLSEWTRHHAPRARDRGRLRTAEGRPRRGARGFYPPRSPAFLARPRACVTCPPSAYICRTAAV